MNDDEKYLFDLNGYLVIEDVLTIFKIEFLIKNSNISYL